jgi:hypothetical protein
MLTCVVERFRRTTSIRAEASTAQLVCAECSVICDEAGLLEPSSQDLRVRDLFSKTRKPARAPEARNAGNSMAIDHDSELFKTVLVADSGEMCPMHDSRFWKLRVSITLEGTSLGAAG